MEAHNGLLANAVLQSNLPYRSHERKTLHRLLDTGFAEMGFGRFGSAVLLGEAISLVAFDASVPEVLENLRAARQPAGSREV